MRPPGLSHRWPVRVYYEDTDFSGVVYHASYLRFLERGRTEWLRNLGLSHSDLSDGMAGGEPAAAFAVRHMTLDFRAPARMDDLLSIESWVDRIGGASIAMRQTVLRDTTLLVAAEVKLALVAAGRAVRLPPAWAERLGRPRLTPPT